MRTLKRGIVLTGTGNAAHLTETSAVPPRRAIPPILRRLEQPSPDPYACAGKGSASVMVTRVATVAFEGIEALRVDVQVQVSSGNVRFVLVGLPTRRWRNRRSACVPPYGVRPGAPARGIVVNLAPADLPKEGSHYDLPIALASWRPSARSRRRAGGFTALGELALDGTLTAVAGYCPPPSPPTVAAMPHLPRSLRLGGRLGRGDIEVLAAALADTSSRTTSRACRSSPGRSRALRGRSSCPISPTSRARKRQARAGDRSRRRP